MAHVSLRMRQVSRQELHLGLPHLEAGFEATRDNAVYRVERESGVLCDLGEDWNFVHRVVTGQHHQPDDVSGLPVLGGVELGQIGPSDRDLILMLSPEDVVKAAKFLQTVDPSRLMEANRPLLAEYTGGILPEPFLKDITTYVERLQRFYSLAAEAGRAVVKRTYTP